MEKIETSSDFEKVIRELNEKLSREYDDFFGITFFGSRSRGDFSSDSDFDIVGNEKESGRKDATYFLCLSVCSIDSRTAHFFYNPHSFSS